MEAESIRSLLAQAFPEAAEVAVEDRTGTGDHFQVTVVSAAFDGVSLIDQHRRVNDALAAPLADGSIHELAFDVPIERSSWIALRIYPSSHTNPIFVLVGDKPIRASRRSAQWCADSVDQCWTSKEPTIRAWEKEAAKKAYDEARAFYEKVLGECEVD